MEKQQIVDIVCNHQHEVFDSVHNCEATLKSLVRNQVPVADQRLMALRTKHMLKYAKDKIDIMIEAIDQWPEE